MTGEQQSNHESGEDVVVPRIYVASLADYNAGRLHGVWLDAAQEPDELATGISSMLARSKEPHAEEWAIHDYEGFNGLHLSEWESMARISKIATGIAEHGLAFAHWVSLIGVDQELDGFEDAYLGHWETITAYAEDILDDLGLLDQIERCVPESLARYVRVDAVQFGLDLQMGGDIMAAEAEDGGVYVYSSL